MGVYKRPDSGEYWISYNFKGRRYRESANTTRKADAQALLGKRQAELFAGSYFPEKKRLGLTFEGLKDDWLKHAAGKKSLRDDETRLGHALEYFGAKKLVALITAEDVEAYRDWLSRRETRRGKPASPADVNRHLAVLRSALKLAKRNKHQHLDPMDGVKFLDEDNTRERICTEQEYERLIEAASPKLRLAIILGRHTAMRLGEIAELDRVRINLKAKTITLRDQDVKKKKGRQVALPPAAHAALKEALATWPSRIDGRLFPESGTDTLSPQFAELCAELKIKDLHFHDLRHTRATELRRSGVDPFTIAATLGHRSMISVRRYQKVTVDDLHEAAKAVEAKKGRKRAAR